MVTGGFGALEAMFDPQVEWRWYEPGEWTAIAARM
jgi:hypothetical protein